ncbi:polysaccharide biosynthesis/export family protein [Methylobacterium sp. A54F]
MSRRIGESPENPAAASPAPRMPVRSGPRRRRAGWLALAALLGLPGPALAEYRIATGDVLEVSVLSLPNFRQEATVGVDGTIAVPLAGELTARGQTVTELRQKLQGALSAKAMRQRGADGRDAIVVIDPNEITVRIARYQPVYISGDVSKAGEHPYRPGLTVRQAVALAGGYNVMRFKMDNPIVETANLRAEYETVWASIARESANVWRLKALIADRRDGSVKSAESRSAAQVLAEAQLQAQNADTNREKTYLQRAMKQSQLQLASLTEQQVKEREGVVADTADFDQVRGLFQRGAVVATRLADARRSVLLSSTRALQTTVQVTQLERDQNEIGRKLDQVDDKRRLEAMERLQIAEAELTSLQGRLRSVNDKLVYTGALRAQLLHGSGMRPDIVVHRAGVAQRLVGSDDLELQPGDVIEVSLLPELGMNVAGSTSGQD